MPSILDKNMKDCYGGHQKSIQHAQISTEILELHKDIFRPHHLSSEKRFINGKK